LLRFASDTINRDDSGRSLIAGAFERIPEMGMSNIADALWDATQYLDLQPKGRRRAILLISDNVSTGSPQLIDNTEGLVREMLEADVTLISIKTSGTESLWKMDGKRIKVSQVTADTGGEVLDVNSLNALSNALSAAVLNLKYSYAMGFYPSDERNRGIYHKLTIMLDKNKCPDCKIWTRKGYYSGDQEIAAGDKKKDSPKSSLTPKKAKWGLLFGMALVYDSSSPQIMLYNEALSKITHQKTTVATSNDSMDGVMLNPFGAQEQDQGPEPSIIGKYTTPAFKSEIRKLRDAIEAVPVTSRVFHRYLTGLRMLWSDSNKIAVSLWFSYLFEKNKRRYAF
jgi:hypothetical protein